MVQRTDVQLLNDINNLINLMRSSNPLSAPFLLFNRGYNGEQALSSVPEGVTKAPVARPKTTRGERTKVQHLTDSKCTPLGSEHRGG